MKNWKWFKIGIASLLIFAIALFGLTLYQLNMTLHRIDSSQFLAKIMVRYASLTHPTFDSMQLHINLVLAKSGWFDWCPLAPYSSPNIPLSGAAASEVGLNYSKLSALLSHKNFKKADRETAEKILQAADKLLFKIGLKIDEQ